jgi:hypothetical protein
MSVPSVHSKSKEDVFQPRIEKVDQQGSTWKKVAAIGLSILVIAVPAVALVGGFSAAKPAAKHKEPYWCKKVPEVCVCPNTNHTGISWFASGGRYNPDDQRMDEIIKAYELAPQCWVGHDYGSEASFY